MASIRITGGTITLSEQTLQDITRAVEKAKTEIEITHEPMPDGDMTTEDYLRERALRGAIRVESSASGIVFEVVLSHSQFGSESLGYRLRQHNADDLEMAIRMLGTTATPLRGTTVHLLYHGRALCGQEGVPREWPKDHCWTQHLHIATCEKCLNQAALDVGL